MFAAGSIPLYLPSALAKWLCAPLGSESPFETFGTRSGKRGYCNSYSSAQVTLVSAPKDDAYCTSEQDWGPKSRAKISLSFRRVQLRPHRSFYLTSSMIICEDFDVFFHIERSEGN